MKYNKIVEDLRQGKNRKAIDYLSKYYSKVQSFVIHHGGSESDAKDIFQEALIVFYKKTLDPNFRLEVKAHTYLYSICKYKWKDELIKMNRKVSFKDELKNIENLEPEENDQEEKYEKLKEIMASIGDLCANILKDFYYNKLTMTEIAKKYNYKNVSTAKTQKYKCIERARNLVINK